MMMRHWQSERLSSCEHLCVNCCPVYACLRFYFFACFFCRSLHA